MLWFLIILLLAAAAVGLYLHLRPKALMPLVASLKLWSQQLNLFVSMVISAIIADGGQFVPQLINMLPEPYRYFLAPLGGVLAFLLVSYLRLAPQKKLQEPPSK